MPRRGIEVPQLSDSPKKRLKVEDDVASMDVSFYDDEALPPGIVFTDVLQKKWRIGKPIGRGSFGRIYLASDNVESDVTKLNARYVVKIEPHTNGPLFVEIHCLIRSAQADNVKEWRTQKKKNHLGMPIYIASGSFTDEKSGIKYRFLVVPRYDRDLQKLIERGGRLQLRNVLVLANQILDVLEYLHKQGYTHSDIKSSNLMLGFESDLPSKIPVAKPTHTFQKETKELAVLSNRQRRTKSNKQTLTNYYEDKDFVVNPKSCFYSSGEDNCDKALNSVKKKFRKILSDKGSRTLHRHHAFNLRQLSSYVNYEDFSSSVCSDASYQKLVDGYDSKKQLAYSSDEGFHSDHSTSECKNKKAMFPAQKAKADNANNTSKEAIHSQSKGQIYLLDYGLASKFLDSKGEHKVFGMDARKAHDGTLEYSSRDSHIGAHSRRSDLETLGYNLLDWLTGTLPWKTTQMLAEPDLVHVLKKNFMSNVKSLLRTCFKTDNYPQFLEKYFEYITKLDFTEKPNYDYCRSIFRNEFVKNGFGSERHMMLDFSDMYTKNCKVNTANKFGMKSATSYGCKNAFEIENMCSLENNLKLELLRESLNSSSDGIRKPCTSRNFFISDADLVARLKKSLMPQEIIGKKLSPKNLRSKKIVKKRRGKRTHRSSIGKFGNFMGSARQFTWAEILAGNPEDIIRKDRNNSNEEEDKDTCKYRIRKLSDASDNSNNDQLQSPLMQKDYLQGLNPTYAMKEVLVNFKRKVSGKPCKEVEDEDKYEGCTPAMVRVMKIKEKRKLKEMQEMKILNDKAKGDVPKRNTRSRKATLNTPKTKAPVPVQPAAFHPVVVIQKEVKGNTKPKTVTSARNRINNVHMIGLRSCRTTRASRRKK